MNTQQSPVRFFMEHAGFSYRPGQETEYQGRYRCARALAAAERKARDAGFSWTGEVDEIDSSEWSDEEPPYRQWLCIMRDAEGKVRGSLGGVDFGRDGEPWGDSYRRVVEAELAVEHFA
jgi:hypothetical protein